MQFIESSGNASDEFYEHPLTYEMFHPDYVPKSHSDYVPDSKKHSEKHTDSRRSAEVARRKPHVHLDDPHIEVHGLKEKVIFLTLSVAAMGTTYLRRLP